MGAQGQTTVDFGAFPGSDMASAVITGQAAIVAGSLVEAWIRPEATADHTADEHMVEPLRVFAGNIVAGTGFTIYVFNDNRLPEPLVPFKGSTPSGAVTSAQVNPALNQMPTCGGKLPRVYGQWTVAWVWN